jgi:hypothetical protein
VEGTVVDKDHMGAIRWHHRRQKLAVTCESRLPRPLGIFTPTPILLRARRRLSSGLGEDLNTLLQATVPTDLSAKQVNVFLMTPFPIHQNCHVSFYSTFN